MKHVPDFNAVRQPFSDDFGIGMENVARIRLDISKKDMALAAKDAFSTGYINPDWRAMQRRLFDRASADYEAAKAVLS